ncbi:MAG: cache domain-containing protein [Anaerolineales bacterium]|nr:cache domain-containing protein [Anaerolineales bacterium]
MENDSAYEYEGEQGPHFIFSLRWKIILPFITLALLLIAGLSILLMRQQGEADELRFLRQLRDSGQQVVDEVVRVESRLLEIERAIANTEGVPEAAALSDAETLRSRILQIVINSDVDVAVVLDREGTSLLALRKPGPDPAPGDLIALRGEGYYREWEAVQKLLQLGDLPLDEDEIGAKQAGMETIFIGEDEYRIVFVGGPIYDEQGTVLGAVLVGVYLDNLLEQLARIGAAHVSVYDHDTGQFVATDLELRGTETNSLALSPQLIEAAYQPDSSGAPYRTIQLAGQTYGEVLSPFRVRNQSVDLGLFGISLLGGEFEETIAASSNEQMRNVLIFGGLALVLILGTGLLVSNWVTRPIEELTAAAQDTLLLPTQRPVPETRRDEIGTLAKTLYRMADGIHTQGDGFAPARSVRRTLTSGQAAVRGQMVKVSVAHIFIGGLVMDGAAGDAATVIESVNRVHRVLLEIIDRHHGQVEAVSGDEFRIHFGVSPKLVSMPVSSMQATHAALEALEFVHEHNEFRTAVGKPPLDLGVGISTGWVAAGEIGGDDHSYYTFIGKTVNIARRIGQATRSVRGGAVLVDDGTYRYLNQARAHFKFGRYGQISTEIEDREIGVYEVEGREFKLVDCSDLYLEGERS